MNGTRLVGVDLGQANDHTAVAVIDKTGDGSDATYAVRHLERFQVGMLYPAQVERISELFKASEAVEGEPAFTVSENRMVFTGPPAVDLVVDQTGVGRPVVDMLRDADLPVKAVTITGGDEVSQNGDEYRVPKRELVSSVQVLLQSGRLKIARALPHARILTDELLGFRISINARGHDSYGNDVGEWRQAQHDDLVLAVALAAWYGEAAGPPMLYV